MNEVANGAVNGGALGFAGGSGMLLAIRMLPPLRRVRLVDRVAPYLGFVATKPFEAGGPASGPIAVLHRLLGPAVVEMTKSVERLVGGSTSVRRRLAALGSAMTIELFRLEQLSWAISGLLLLGGSGVALGRPPLVVVGLASAGLCAGFLARDWWLGRQLARRETALLAALPVVADLLALAVLAGESAPGALARVCRLTSGPLADELRMALNDARSGSTLSSALARLAARTSVDALGRFLGAITLALERGTPLAGVLRSQADDVRDLTKRSLMDAGGRAEIAMLLPVVFLVLPVTVVFALYPGLLTLTSLTH